MGINLTEISQKVLDVVKNGANIYRKMYDLHYNPTPMDVPMEYVDENGVKRTTNIPNVANFRKRVWDDVGGALGQFSRTFYVDQINGDDNNDGGLESPFKTLMKAINSVPIGGYGSIKLLSDVEIGSDITIRNKIIRISTNDTSINRIVKNKAYFYSDTYGCKTTGFILESSALYFHYLTIQTANFPGDGIDYTNKPNYYTGIIVRLNTEGGSYIVCSDTTIFLGDTPFARLSNRQNVDFVFYNRNFNFYDFSVTCNGANVDGKLVYNEAGTLRIDYSNFTLGTKLDGTQLIHQDLIAGIVRDGNGLPRNIISNVIF